MRAILSKHRNTINILFPVIITVCIFISGNLGQRISEIYSEYIIDTNTLNNTFITLAIFASAQDNESFQKTKNNINEQMKQSNEKYEKSGEERKAKEAYKLWLDRAIYTLIILLIIFNVVITTKNCRSDPSASK